MYCKWLCKKSVFAINHNYLSEKYDLCQSGWYNDVSNLLGKVKIKYVSVYDPMLIIGILLELCDLRDGNI